MDKKTKEEIDALLNSKNDSEEWPEFEIIKDDVVDFMGDLPIETYEHLLKSCQLEPERLIQYLLDFPKIQDNQKECFNYCPKCGATDPDIEWGDKDWSGKQGWQNATCQKCGCEFTEVYEYVFSEIDEPCEKPMPNPDE